MEDKRKSESPDAPKTVSDRTLEELFDAVRAAPPPILRDGFANSVMHDIRSTRAEEAVADETPSLAAFWQFVIWCGAATALVMMTAAYSNSLPWSTDIADTFEVADFLIL